MPFSDVELRVLGALVEKERTTPDAYPLSPQALLTACNQRTSREPVTDYHLQEVQEAAFRLRERGFVATVQEVSDRVAKHRHQLARVWDVAPLELALLAVLMLRGEQTPGELRARIERYGVPNDAAAVEAALRRLAERGSPLVENLGRRPGQSQDRWRHTLAGGEERLRPRVRGGDASAATDAGGADRGDGAAPSSGRPVGRPVGSVAEPGARPTEQAATLADLAARVAALERRIAALEASPRDGD
jgi:uncharacterized protein